MDHTTTNHDNLVEQKIEVKFKTSMDRHRIIEKPFQIPVSLNRRGLSQIINHLLGTNPPILFDFLIDGQFLRTSIEKFIKSNNKTTEQIITIEYMELLDDPIPESIKTHSDWISSIDNQLLSLQKSLANQGITGYTHIIPYGSYDNRVSLFFHQTQSCQDDHHTTTRTVPLAIGKHEQPVLAVSSFTFSNDGKIDILSSSQDASIYLWKVDIRKETSILTHKFEGHQGAVEDVSFSPSGQLFASASWDNTIKIWSLDTTESTPLPPKKKSNHLNHKNIKRRKVVDDTLHSKEDTSLPVDTSQAKTISERSSFVGHMQCVSSCLWKSEDEICSGSWDHSIKIWDVESGINTSQLHGNKVILAMDISPKNQLIITGHADRTVRVWDPRSHPSTSDDNNHLFSSYNSHLGWVNTVKWHPENDHLAISASYDSSIKVWDIRSSTPLCTLPSQHQDKVLALGWITPSLFVSGGADQDLRLYQFPNHTPHSS